MAGVAVPETMPMSTADHHNRHKGFTLIEMLVVLLLVGLALGVTLRVGFGNDPQDMESGIRALAVATELASQDAVLDNEIIGLDFFRDPDLQQTGYRWLQFDGEKWVAQESGTAAPAETYLQASLQISLFIDGMPKEPELRVGLALADNFVDFAPEIILLPTREMTPFVLELESAGNRTRLGADMLGKLYFDADPPQPPL
jgi:general secretion pathway protein H